MNVRKNVTINIYTLSEKRKRIFFLFARGGGIIPHF